jgi:RNA polymerase sigma-70 factor, ECF subfamily
MQKSGEFSELVKQSHQGDEASRDRLANLVRVRLEEYVYRLTLQEDMTQDIVQETLLTMFKVLGKLRNTDRFWPWIYKIAFTHTLKAQRDHKRQRDIIREMPKTPHTDNPLGLTNLVHQELQQVVMQAIGNLKPRHRQVLDLRCYANLEYKDIAEVMDCSEFGTRLLFWRAKNALQKQLSRFGFKKGAFITALVVFGKMTARSEASGSTVTAGSLKVGAAAAAAPGTACAQRIIRISCFL